MKTISGTLSKANLTFNNVSINSNNDENIIANITNNEQILKSIPNAVLKRQNTSDFTGYLSIKDNSRLCLTLESIGVGTVTIFYCSNQLVNISEDDTEKLYNKEIAGKTFNLTSKGNANDRNNVNITLTFENDKPVSGGSRKQVRKTKRNKKSQKNKSKSSREMTKSRK
jgi:hypothetical protein